VARRVVFAILIAACGATQTDPPDRPTGSPPRDGGGGAGGGDASGDGSTTPTLDSGNTTVDIGDDAGIDARVDGAECTTSSSIAAPIAPAAGLALAAYSAIGFSGTQGKCGWSYGYVAPATSTAFLLMTQYDTTGEAWYVENGVYWTFHNRNTTHPNGITTGGGRMAIDHWSVRRWTSNLDGQVRITGTVKKAAGAVGGNGIVARVMVGANKIYEQTIVDEAGMTFDVTANVALDQPIDFVVDPNASEDGVDSTDVSAAIWK
jgi:hypothetical protein